MKANNAPKAAVEVQSWRIKEWFPDLTEDQCIKFRTYFEELKKFNNALNLVSPKTLSFADVIHFGDSIIASRLVFRAEGGKVPEIYDIGSGNGFPGMVFAILYPSSKVVLVDKDERKAEFLKHLASVLGLKNLSVKVDSVERMSQGSVALAISRGFAPISKAALIMRRSIMSGGSMYMLKSEEWATEVSQIPSQLCSFWEPSLAGEYKLPVGDVKFAVVKMKKIAE